MGFQGNFNGVSVKFQRVFSKVSRVFHVRLKFQVISSVLERSSKGVSGKFQWCFNAVCFTEISKKSPRSFMKISKVFQ